MRSRKQEAEEERKRLAEKVAAEQRKEEDWSDLRSEIEALKVVKMVVGKRFYWFCLKVLAHDQQITRLFFRPQPQG